MREEDGFIFLGEGENQRKRVFLVIDEDFFLRGDPRAVGEGKEKRVRDSWSLGCYGGEAVERETFSEAKLGVLLIFARERLPQV